MDHAQATRPRQIREGAARVEDQGRRRAAVVDDMCPLAWSLGVGHGNDNPARAPDGPLRGDVARAGGSEQHDPLLVEIGPFRQQLPGEARRGVEQIAVGGDAPACHDGGTPDPCTSTFNQLDSLICHPPTVARLAWHDQLRPAGRARPAGGGFDRRPGLIGVV